VNDFVTKPEPNSAAQRIVNCSRCGAAFTCDLSGRCWCMDETAKLPMPVDGEDCLCRDCLRAAANLSIHETKSSSP
jgi:ribosomal protein S14